MKDTKFFKMIDFEQVNEYKSLRKDELFGFAQVYLGRCNEESKSNDEVDKEVYAKLVELDTRLGTRASEQLFDSLYHTTRSDIIKVLT